MVEKEKIVVDASIIAKWFLDEEYSSEALMLRNDYVRGLFIIAVPTLLEYEVLNALKYSRVYSMEELLEIGNAINKYGFLVYELENDYKKLTIMIAEESGLSIYDAAYVALAKYLNTKLYTADNEIIEKFPKIAIHIREYKTGDGGVY